MTTFLVCLFAGLGAGLGTGFAGMSAAAVISPMLIAFLDMEPYQAIGIALASDVLASAVSAYTYGKNKNLDVKNGLVMMVTVMIFTFISSYAASFVPSNTMGGFSTFMTLLLGIKFIVKPVMTTKETMAAADPKKRFVQSVVCGIVIGCICGFVGAGGGMMMLSDPDFCVGIRAEDGSGNKCVYHDIHGIHRSRQSFCDRWYAGSYDSDSVCDQHTDLCANRCSACE